MLLVYAHPNRDGHCGYILKQVETQLKEMNISYSVLDLYQENYDSILKPEEHYTSGHYEISTQTKNYQKLIKNETRFIFIYPTWWNNMPAILKGFFDRTLTSRFAFYYEGLIPHGLLKGKALVFTTVGGPAIIEKLFLGNRSLNLVTKDVLRFCGIKARGVLIGSSRKFTIKQRIKIEKNIKKNIKFIL